MSKRRSHSKKRIPPRNFFYCKFPNYGEIQCYLRLMAQTFPSKVKLKTIGYSTEGREILMIIISKCSSFQKNCVFIEGGIHAREWLAHATVLYIIDCLVTGSRLLNYMDFYIIPCINPDGYEYTHTVDRLWRKNMNHNGTTCTKKWGVDLNRNFPLGFGGVGSSRNPESNLYCGTHPLSEPETRCLAKVLKRYARRIKLYLSVHTYGNVIMYPWGCTKRRLRDWRELQCCGDLCKDVMANNFKDRHFKVGPLSQVMYFASGNSLDYVRGVHKIKFAFTMELQKYGPSGFTPPSIRKTLSVAKETMCGIGAMVRYVYQYYEKRKKKLTVPTCKIKKHKRRRLY